MKRSTPAAQLIADALDAEPTVASRTLASRLYKKYPKSWPSYNACWLAVRRQRGAAGEKNRVKMAAVLVPRTPEDAAACNKWGALLPEPMPNKWAWQTMPEGISRWLILSDIHFPFHDKQALSAALDFAHGECDGVLLNGDTIDAYSLSYFEKDPEMVDFDRELDNVEKFLDLLVKWGASKIVMKGGNHCMRLERYLIAKAPELLAAKRIRERLNFRAFLDLDARGVQWVEPMDPISVGKLCIVHGHEWGGSITNPVNPARGAFLRGRECCIVGHHHRTSENTVPSMRGTIVTTWSTGALCCLNPRYRPLNDWNHGMCILDLSGPEWQVKNYRIVNGRVL